MRANVSCFVGAAQDRQKRKTYPTNLGIAANTNWLLFWNVQKQAHRLQTLNILLVLAYIKSVY